MYLLTEVLEKMSDLSCFQSKLVEALTVLVRNVVLCVVLWGALCWEQH